MRLVFITFMILFLLFAVKPKCSRDIAEKQCVDVCGDIGYDFKGEAVQTGLFTYTCVCKNWKPSNSFQLR